VSRPATGPTRLRETARWLILLADRLEAGEARRHQFDPFIAELKAVQQDCFGRRPNAQPGQGAKARILAYLQQHVGEDIRGEDIAAMSGIQEWARRVRELRAQDGYDIVEIGKSTYRLERLEPDLARAERRHRGNPSRREGQR
jgi:hypothetical protein